MSLPSRAGATTLQERSEVKGIISIGQNTTTLDKKPICCKSCFERQKHRLSHIQGEDVNAGESTCLCGPPLNRCPSLPSPLYQIVPLWTSLEGLAGPLTWVILCWTLWWTSASVGLERQLTFRPYQGLLASTEFVPFSKASRMLSDELKRTAGDPLGCSKWLV